jgi:hypothetical protein
MQLHLRSGGQQLVIQLENSEDRRLVLGEHTYQTRRLAAKVRRLAGDMWREHLTPDILNDRLTFEAADQPRAQQWSDSGSFSPRSGSFVTLGRWNEDGSVGIALHELAHEMHLRQGGYDDSDGVVREALALLAERESGLRRSFEREPYHSASQFVSQLMELRSYSKQPFAQRWSEMVTATSEVELADLVNFYLDRDERIGLARWLKRFVTDTDRRDHLMTRLASVSLRYSLPLRRVTLDHLVRIPLKAEYDRVLAILDSIATLDRRYPHDDLEQIIRFCFAPHVQPRRRFAFGL